MFSIIIPLYNKKNFVENCLRSIYDQTLHDFEIILVDDGSTDGGIDTVRNFINKVNCNWIENESIHHLPEIRLFFQENLGVSSARNTGVKASRRDYIAFLDADDWWEPTYLEEMKSLIDNYPEAGIYGCGYYLFKNGKKRIAPIGVENNFSDGSINYFQVYGKNLCMPLWTGATIVKKEIFEQENGFKSGIKLGEDLDLWIRIALKHKVVLLNKPLAFYNQDVELSTRAVGVLHKPENHILWNLSYLKNEELVNRDLKNFLDKLRLYALYPYYLNPKTRNDSKKELDKVDWASQPKNLTRKYAYPVFLMLWKQKFMQVGSGIKSLIIRKRFNYNLSNTVFEI